MTSLRARGSRGITLPTIAPTGPSLSRPATSTTSSLSLASRRIATQARSADINELEQIITQLFPKPEEQKMIMELHTKEGQPFFTLVEKEYLLEVWALAQERGFDAALELLQQLGSASQITAKNPLLDPIRQQLQLEDELLERNEEVTEGEYTCINPSCRSKKIGRRLKQTRSADEGMDVFLHCPVCSKRWRERG